MSFSAFEFSSECRRSLLNEEETIAKRPKRRHERKNSLKVHNKMYRKKELTAQKRRGRWWCSRKRRDVCSACMYAGMLVVWGESEVTHSRCIGVQQTQRVYAAAAASLRVYPAGAC